MQPEPSPDATPAFRNRSGGARDHSGVPRVSVVVPIFNVEPFLEACLDSLAGQTFADLEVVMVDDGSTDASPAIAAGFAARDPRFRPITQANRGVGAGRP